MSSVAERTALVKSTLIDHIAHVELRVCDVDRALGFYRDVVGLHVAKKDSDVTSVGTSSSPDLLRLRSVGVVHPADPRSTGLFHTAIRFPTRPALGDALARLVDARLEIGAGDHLVSEALYIDDPDGNGVELYWDRPADEWPPPADGMITPMATLPVDLHGLLDEGRGAAAVAEAAPDETDVGHVHLQVSDVDATTHFYRDVVGLDVTAHLGSSAAFFSSNGYHHNIGTNTWRSRGAKPSPKDHAGLDRVVFAVTDGDALAELRNRMRASGTSWSDDADELVVADPDGIELRFFAAR